MRKQPKFSIIVPVYNVEKYLTFCMESLIGQTLKDIEIICVNDGSTDNSLEILEEYKKIDDRVKVIDKRNGGLSSARNAGLDVAEGEFILFVDSDDCLDKNACDRLYMEILQENADIIVFGTEIFPWYISSEQNAWLWNLLQVNTKKYEGNAIQALFWERASKPFVWNECYRRSVLEDNNIQFDESLRYGEDMLFLFMIFPRVDKVVYIQDKLYQYRCEREGSLMNIAGHNMEYKMDMHMRIIEKILADWKENNYIEKVMDELCWWCLEFMVYDLESRNISNEYRKKTATKFKEILDEYQLHFVYKNKASREIENRLINLVRNN